MGKSGFSRRERRGILYLCFAVVVVLAIGPISDAVGCTRRVASEEATGGEGVVMYAPDSVLENQKPPRIKKEERSEAHKYSDSIKNAVNKSQKQSEGSGKNKKTTKTKKKSVPSENRSFHDEQI